MAMPLRADSPRLIRVLVASRRAAVVNRLRSALSRIPGVLVLGSPSTASEPLVESIDLHCPDVLILGLRMLRGLGADAITRLTRMPSRPRVLLVCDRPQQRVVGTVLKWRFYGYIRSRDESETLATAVRCVSRGELWLPRRALADALYGGSRGRLGASGGAERRRSSALRAARASLTAREGQVTNLLRQGCSNKEIANELGIKEDTVKKHLRTVFAKYGVRRRTQLLVRAP